MAEQKPETWGVDGGRNGCEGWYFMTNGMDGLDGMDGMDGMDGRDVFVVSGLPAHGLLAGAG